MKFQPFADDDARVEAIAKYFPIIEKINAAELRRKTARVWIRALSDCPWNDLDEACFGPAVPDQTLVDHILVTTEGAYELAVLMNRHQKIGLDLDLIIALGLLHDVSKVFEYEPDGEGGRYSELGKKVQHGFMGAIYAMEEGFSLDMINLLISHTPQSNTVPVAREGMLFAFIDLADADMLCMEKNGPIFYKRLH
jgi:putative nucleotidyltransferase with HDIG domain